MLVYQRVNIVNICGSSPTWRGSRVATRLGPMINQLLGGNGLLDPNMTSFLVDGSMAMVYHWFYHMTSLKLRESQPRCQVSAAVVLAAFFTMQRWLYPQGAPWTLEVGGTIWGTFSASKANRERKTRQAVATDDIHEISAFFGQERVRSNGQKV